MSGGTAQPATETLAYALRQLGYQVDLDDKALIKMADFFKGVRADFLKDGTLDPISMATDTQCLNYQIPGGMLSNLISQLKMMNAMDLSLIHIWWTGPGARRPPIIPDRAGSFKTAPVSGEGCNQRRPSR